MSAASRVDKDTPDFMSWPIPADIAPPNVSGGKTEAHVWQDGRCGICGDHESTATRRHVLDHDHDTGLIRGILCVGCNLQEGLSDRPIFNKWRSGMNPCAVFGWTYTHRHANTPKRISADDAARMVRRAHLIDMAERRTLLEPAIEMPWLSRHTK